MQTLHEIKAMLEARGLSPKKALGQNFLIDANLITKLIEASGVGEGYTVLEVGPGTGVLTEALLRRGCRVVAGELDDALCDLLSERLGSYGDRFTLVRGDCLENKRTVNRALIGALGDGPFTLVANLPYHAGTPLMLSLLADHPRCRGLHVTIQREVADRMMARPASAQQKGAKGVDARAYGAISAVVGCVATARLVAALPRECFWPRPGVASAMLSVVRVDEPLTDDARSLAEFCQRAFAGRRKQLGSLLRAMAGEEHGGGRSWGVPSVWPDGVEPTDRIEQLSPGVIADLERACRA